MISCDIVPDFLIRDLSDADIDRLDRRARALGLSRAEYVRQLLRGHASPAKLSRADLEAFSEVCGDLADPDVIARAWE